jgi:uncharacterized protein YkwD
MPTQSTERQRVTKKYLVRLFATAATLLLSTTFASAQDNHTFNGRPLPISQAPNSSIYLDPATQATTPSEPKEISRVKENKVSKQPSINELEKHLFELINKDREKEGLSKLQFDSRLSAFARKHAEDMMTHDRFTHLDTVGRSTKQRAAAAGIMRPVYENLGWQSGTDSPGQKIDDLENSFMAEPLGEYNHRYIILIPQHTCVGVGVARKKDELYLVQEFADTLSDVSRP